MTPISNQTFLSEKYSWKIVDCVVHYFVFTIFTCIISVSISCTNTFHIASHILPRSLYHTIMIVWKYSGTGRVFMYSQKKPSISQPSLIITISRPSSNIQWGCWGYILRLMLSAARNNSLRHQWTFHLPRCHCWLTSKDIMLPVHKWVLQTQTIFLDLKLGVAFNLRLQISNWVPTFKKLPYFDNCGKWKKFWQIAFITTYEKFSDKSSI